MNSPLARFVAPTLLLSALTAGQIPTGVQFEAIYDQSRISFDQPTFIGGVPGLPHVLIVTQRDGKVFQLARNGATYEKSAWFSVPANTATHWDGAWGIEFHPAFAQNRLFYILWRQKTPDTRSVIEEWKVDAGGLANPRKVRAIMHFTQNSIHSSGDLHFGRDGFLYSSQGDRQIAGGAQNLNELYGKLIRIDVDRKDPGLEYAIPADNPFRGQSGVRPEIWAVGFRVPWRFAFDRLNDDIYLADVGDTKADEINIVQKGRNYGATTVEGNCTSNCANFVNPVWQLSRQDARCVIGGFVYREDPSSKFYGIYIFADYELRRLFGMRLNAEKNGVAEKATLTATTPSQISALGQDADGNAFAAMYRELGSELQRQTHIYRLKHPELRPRVPSAVAPLHSFRYPAASGLVYGLDGKLAGPADDEPPGNGLFILRDPRTGMTVKRVRLGR